MMGGYNGMSDRYVLCVMYYVLCTYVLCMHVICGHAGMV